MAERFYVIEHGCIAEGRFSRRYTTRRCFHSAANVSFQGGNYENND
ncbi:hypothetical protein V1281_004702 [Nitrobacteraceae bacterium AZCC 2161]